MAGLFKQQSLQLLLVLSALVALGPLSTDMYLPALPAMVEAFGAEISQVQLTLSAYLTGFSVFHLFCGPFSDRFGRKPVLCLGIGVFFLSSVACSSADTVSELIFWRFFQGLGACVGPTLARAMVRDMYGPTQAAKALGYMSAIMALAPIIAPVLGGWLLLYWQWPIIFLLLAAYSVIILILVIIRIPESLSHQQSLRFSNVTANYWLLLTNSHFRNHVLAASFLYSGAFAFVTGSSYILIEFMAVAPEDFGYWFMFIVIGYLLGSIFTARFSHRFSARLLMNAGAILALASSVVMILLCLLKIYHPLSIVVPIAFYTCAVGIAMPQAIAVALMPFAEMAGTASALMGFCQMAAASLAAAIVGITLTGEPLPLAVTLMGCSALSFVYFYRLRKQS